MFALSILLLTKNGVQDLKRLLPVLFNQKSVPPFEVIALDSGSTDGTTNLLREYPLRLIEISPNEFHHARTRNLAASLATGEILVFLSQDAIPVSEDWLSHLISNFDDPTVGAVYGRQLPRERSVTERHDTFDVLYGKHRLVKDPAHRNGLGYRFYHFSDVNAAIRRSVWEVTRFPEDLKVFEDLGIAKRMLDRGWKIVYESEAAVFHSHNHGTLGLFRRYFDIGYTLKLLKIWDAPGTRSSLRRDAWQMLKKKLRSIGDSDRRLFEGLKHHIVKSAGLFLGLNQDYLPLTIKRHLSAFRVFG
jgi:rhamnosyltransferase